MYPLPCPKRAKRDPMRILSFVAALAAISFLAGCGLSNYSAPPTAQSVHTVDVGGGPSTDVGGGPSTDVGGAPSGK